MSEHIKQLVDAMMTKDANGTQAAFQAAMAEKISARLDSMRQDVAQSMFKTQEVEVSTEEPTAETETE